MELLIEMEKEFKKLKKQGYNFEENVKELLKHYTSGEAYHIVDLLFENDYYEGRGKTKWKKIIGF